MVQPARRKSKGKSVQPTRRKFKDAPQLSNCQRASDSPAALLNTLREARDKKKERKQTQKNGIMKRRQRSKRMKKKMKRKSDFRDRTLKKTDTQ